MYAKLFMLATRAKAQDTKKINYSLFLFVPPSPLQFQFHYRFFFVLCENTIAYLCISTHAYRMRNQELFSMHTAFHMAMNMSHRKYNTPTISDSNHLHKTHFIPVVSYKNKNYDFDIIFGEKPKDTNV